MKGFWGVAAALALLLAAAAPASAQVANSPAEFTAHIQSDTTRWAKVIKAAGIKPSE